MIDNKTIRKVIMLNKMLPGGSPTYENREASGAVANFTTNVVKPFVKCECTIDATESGISEVDVSLAGKNLVESKLEHCGIGAVGVLVVSSSQPYDMQIAKVKSGATYTITTDENTLVGGFFTSLPVNGSTTYNGERLVSSSKTFTSPIDGYFAFRTSFGYATAQLEVGSTSTEYTPYVAPTTTIVTLEEAAYGGSVDVIAGSGQIIDEYGNLVYTLFEPVSISALEGVNNVCCDTGNIKVTYKYKTGEGGSTKKKYLPIFYDFYGKGCRHL